MITLLASIYTNRFLHISALISFYYCYLIKFKFLNLNILLLSLEAFPASSSTSAARYSRTAARYTGAPPPILSANLTLKFISNY